ALRPPHAQMWEKTNSNCTQCAILVKAWACVQLRQRARWRDRGCSRPLALKGWEDESTRHRMNSVPLERNHPLDVSSHLRPADVGGIRVLGSARVILFDKILYKIFVKQKFRIGRN